MMTASLGLGIWLTGCSPAFVPVEDPSESQTEERNSPEMEKDDQREDLAFQPLSEEERRWIVTELESFDGDHKFSDMDPEKAASCPTSNCRSGVVLREQARRNTAAASTSRTVRATEANIVFLRSIALALPFLVETWVYCT